MTDETQTIAAGELRQFIERIERVNEEISGLTDDRKEILQEAKGRGYDTKAINTLVKLRAKDENERLEEEAILETYKDAIGLQ